MGIGFNSFNSNISEETGLKKPTAIVKSLALRKAEKAAKKFPNKTIIAADTLVACKKQILGKPRNIKDAFKLLSIQNGSWQSVYTGVAIIRKNKKLTGYEVS